ncbi:MAG: matrixin family metalloprotease [Oscillatoria sp. PMC 1051.18]|nr:matrixin family metalloprotease [Oscillatoria sp. PMC 1050.18]MEC5032280.1 matrixin family metalloprotease [Oscillatoria sp. PMC 1051.18]
MWLTKNTFNSKGKCKWWRRSSIFGIAIATSLLFILAGTGKFAAETSRSSLPELKVHPLPPSLAQWSRKNRSGDYFSQVKSTSLGYLIWSNFPIKYYLDRPINPDENIVSDLRFLNWVNAVTKAIEEWDKYLPLQEVENVAQADLIIKRKRPSLREIIDLETGETKPPRARTALTSYEFYLRVKEDNSLILAHRMTIELSTGMSERQTLATARHEIGHALGIWGHSQQETDALYYSQVANPPAISPRDVNTLKKIYEQPTRLGWLVGR